MPTNRRYVGRSVSTLNSQLAFSTPGKSNAFAISRKLGLPEFIIDDAKKHIDSQDESFEDVISNLEASRVQMEQDKEQIAAYKEEMESLKKQLSAQKEKLEQQKAKILQDAVLSSLVRSLVRSSSRRRLTSPPSVFLLIIRIVS